MSQRWTPRPTSRRASGADPRRRAATALVAAVATVAAGAGAQAATPTGAQVAPSSAAPAASLGDPAARVGGAAKRLVRQARAADSHCVAVVRRGRMLLDKDLAPDVATTQAWSVTKSVTAVLVGIAQDQGHLDLDDRVSKYVKEWRGTPSRDVTVRHLLSNTSGREWSFDTDYLQMAGKAKDKTRFAIRLSQQDEPGTTWFYNNSAIQVLERVLRRATGTKVSTYAQRHLFGPLGMSSTTMTADAAGNTLTYAGVMSTCRDLTRFGVMLADRGRHDGRRIVSKAFVKRATQRSSSQLNAAYGLLFWINEPGPVLPAVPAAEGTPVPQGPMVPGASDDAFWAIGLNQQHVYVDPSRDLVAVRLGAPPPAESGYTLARFVELAQAVARKR